MSDCGPNRNESCCVTLPVPRGLFFRSYDGVSRGYTSQTNPASVSPFALDRFEVTIGRFRQFVLAWDRGWRPATGAGRQVNLNGGLGLANSSAPGSYETGWQESWEDTIPTTAVLWNEKLACPGAPPAWTSSPGDNERRPVNCITWFEAYAFCIWDGGSLPSEAQWNYAASGGEEQRVYPWSNPPNSTSIGCKYVNGSPCSEMASNGVGSKSPVGDGRWGHADLAGSVSEWNLDAYSSYVTPCSDCAYWNTDTFSYRVTRGGAFYDGPSAFLTAVRLDFVPRGRAYGIGARCLRPL